MIISQSALFVNLFLYDLRKEESRDSSQKESLLHTSSAATAANVSQHRTKRLEPAVTAHGSMPPFSHTG